MLFFLHLFWLREGGIKIFQRRKKNILLLGDKGQNICSKNVEVNALFENPIHDPCYVIHASTNKINITLGPKYQCPASTAGSYLSLQIHKPFT